MRINRIWSLLDVLRLYAPSYLNLGRIYEEYISSSAMLTADPNALPSDDELGRVCSGLRSIAEICNRMQLTVSERSIKRTLRDFSRERPNHATTKQKFLEWYNCFQSELEAQIYMLVLPHRVGYWSSEADQLEGSEITKFITSSLAAFPNAVYDAREAGNCFAYERFTACVYHLMRVAEYALVSVAQSSGAKPDMISKGWDGCIGEIHSWIKATQSTKPTIDWKEEVKVRGDLCAWLTAIQKGWRNPVSHIPRIYSEDNAKAMLLATMALLEHCEQMGFRQVMMPDVFPVDAA